MPYVYAALFIVGLVGLYVLSYYLNSKTKAPEGCELPDDFEGCGGCASTGCISRVDPNHPKR